MLPVRDALPVPTFPRVVLGLIALQALVFLGLVAPEATRMPFASWLDGGATSSSVARVAALVTNPGLVVWLANGWFLWLFGEAVEDRLGHARFLGFFVVCGLVGAWVAEAIITGSRVVVGPIAATSAVIGAHLVLCRGAHLLALVAVPFRWDVAEVSASSLAILWFFLPVVGQVGIPVEMEPLAGTHGLLVASITGLALGAALARPARRPERDHVSWWGR